MIPDELHWRLLRLLHQDPTYPQRALARALGISLGSANHAVQALLARGWIERRGTSPAATKSAVIAIG